MISYRLTGLSDPLGSMRLDNTGEESFFLTKGCGCTPIRGPEVKPGESVVVPRRAYRTKAANREGVPGNSLNL